MSPDFTQQVAVLTREVERAVFLMNEALDQLKALKSHPDWPDGEV